MTGVKLQGVGLVPSVGARRVATFVGSGVGEAERMDVVAGGGAPQAEKVISIKIVIRIVLGFVFIMTVCIFSPWRRLRVNRITKYLLW
jgi:hypothetical protein